MIAEQLAGKRIAITGSTGFVGTALVERLLRAAPGCELVLLIRPSKRHDATERARREIFKNNAFDRLKAELVEAGGETFDEMIARRVLAIGGDVSTDGLGLNDADKAIFAACDTIIHSAAAVSFDSPLDLAVEINLLGPPRIADTLQRAERHAAPGGGQHVLRRRQPARQRPGDARQRGPVGHRSRLAQGGRGHPPPARRHRGRQPPPRPARQVPRRGPPGARRRRRTRARRQDRAPAHQLGEGAAGRGRPRPRRQRRLARRLRLHQGTRRAGRSPRSRATCRSASCAPASSSPHSPSRSPAGSAASAWPSRSSSATPAACSRSSRASPRAPSTSSPSTSSSSAIIAVAALGPERAAPHHTGGQRWHQPA